MERHKSALVEVAGDIFGVVNAEDDSSLCGFGANQAFIVLEESVLIFDSGPTPQKAKELDGIVRSITDRKVSYLVNSHGHSNHISGNSFFLKRYGDNVRVISHINCSERIEGARTVSRRHSSAISKTPKKSSSESSHGLNFQYFSNNLQVSVEGTDLVFVHPENGAHTLGDSMLFIPERNAFLAGDIVYNSFFPNLQEAHIDSWLDVLNNFDFQTYTKCLPGHGELCDKRDIQQFMEYLKQVSKRLRRVDTKLTTGENLRLCFEFEGTESWKARPTVDRNILSMFGKSIGT